MTYTTTLETVKTAGIGVQIMNENVGTGTGSLADFDLDNGNIVAGSYTLKYAASSSSNNFTDLTETTHYTIDKDGGTILLTTAGKTALSTNILFADYTHSPKVSDTILNSYLEKADDEVDYITGNYWGSVTSFTEFFDGRRSDTYPTTDRPYARADWDEPDAVQLKRKSIQTLSGVYFLKKGASIGSCQTYDTTTATYTNNTSEANTSGGTAFQPFATTTAANDYLYIGFSSQFFGVTISLFTNGVTSGTNTIEYYDGTTWTAFTPTESTTGVLDIEASGKLSWSILASWTQTTVNSSGSLYFIRIVANSTYSTEAKINNIYADQDFVIDTNIPLYQMDYNSDGRVTFLSHSIPNGTRNIRIDYTSGYSTTPPLITELASLVCGLRIYANITGGSYDDATMFTLGRKSVSIGEVYVNVREVVRQFEVRIQSILDQLGRKMNMCAF